MKNNSEKLKSSLLSVIIPVYNVEKYIKRCIDSVLANDVNLEIIVINDASKDSSLTILQEYGNKINLINLEKNQGASNARNIGLKLAKGNYITFIDIDDYIDENTYSKMIGEIVKYSADICVCGCVEEFVREGVCKNSKYELEDKVYNHSECLSEYLLDKISPGLWDKIFSKKLLENINFDNSLTVAEDNLFVLKAFLKADIIVTISNRFYHYVQHDSSIMHNLSDKFLQFGEVINKLDQNDIKYLSENFYDEFAYFKTEMITRGIHSISINTNKKNKKQAKILLKKLCTKDNLKAIQANKYTPKYIKLECFVIKSFGVGMHLALMPIYKTLRRWSKKNG